MATAAGRLSLKSTITLASGHKMPVFGLGTWRSDPGKVRDAVTEAIRLGYRHIDAAQVYQNQHEVGEGIQRAVDKGFANLEDIWVTSKLWNTDHRPERIRPAAERILRELKLKKISQLLIHWPTAFVNRGDDELFPKDEQDNFAVDDVGDNLTEIWKEMEKLVDEGLVDTIGVSNFQEHEVQSILDVCRIRPAVNQVECHPLLPQVQLRDFLKQRSMPIVAYSPLGNLSPDDPSAPCVLRDPTILTLASKYGKSPAQLLIRWSLQMGNIVIPKTVTLARLGENAAVFDFEISPEDMAAITRLGEVKKTRMINPPFRPNGAPVFPE